MKLKYIVVFQMNSGETWGPAIGTFASESRAEKWTKSALCQRFMSHFEVTPEIVALEDVENGEKEMRDLMKDWA